MATAQQKALTLTKGATTVYASGTLPRPPISPDGVIVPSVPIAQPTPGIGSRQISPAGRGRMRLDHRANTPEGYARLRTLTGVLPPVGEAARRDPHVPDPRPGGSTPIDQQVVSPRTPAVTYQSRPWHGAGGVQALGYPPGLVYFKTLGTAMARNLATNWKAGIIDAMWRLGGISLPISSPPGFGYNGWIGDSQTLWYDNPQVYLRNPGVIPMTQGPTFWRYAPGGGIQYLGPSIGDVGNTYTPAALSS